MSGSMMDECKAMMAKRQAMMDQMKAMDAKLDSLVQAMNGAAPPGIGRRRFLDWFLATSLGALIAAALYPVLRFITPPVIPEAATRQVEAGPVNDPELVEKGFKIVQFGSEPVILIRVGEDDFRAFSAVCTHLACIVTFRKERQLIWCYCHNGVYDLTGKNIAGPPPRPLPAYQVHVVPAPEGRPATLIVERA